MSGIKRKAVLLTAATAAISQFAWAANTTWNGNVDTFWGSPNWSIAGNASYTAAANDVLVFDATATTGTSLNNNDPAGTAFNGINFNSTAQSYTLAGNSITLNGDIDDRSTTQAQTIAFKLLLSGSRSINIAPGGNAANGGTVSISGNISDGGSGFGITVTNNALNRLGVGAGNPGGTGGTVGLVPFGSLVLSGSNTYTGTTNVRTGKLILDFTQATAPASDIINNSSPLVIGFAGDPKTAAGIGALSMIGKDGVSSSQTFASTTFGAGANQVSATSGSGGTSNLNLGPITYTPGAAVAFTLPSSGAISASYTLDHGILGGWATVGGDYATISGGNIVALSSYDTTIGAGGIVPNSGGNVLFTGGGNATTATGVTSTDINTLNFTENSTTARTLTVTGLLRLGANGGVFHSGANSGNFTITGGTLTAGGGAGHSGVITFNTNEGANNNQNNLTINSPIQDNGIGFPVTVVKTGPGSLVLGNVSNGFTGGTYLLQGRIQVGNAGNFGSGPIYIEPGGHLFLNTATLPNNLFISGYGSHENTGDFGAIRINGSDNITGTVTLMGDARISSGGTGIVSGRITGGFSLDLEGVTNNTLTISNTSNDWTGNTTIGRGSLSLGASEVIPNSSNVTITTDGNNGNAIGVLEMNGKSETIAGLSAGGTAGADFVQNTLAGTTSTLTVGFNDTSSNFAGTIRNNGTGTGGTVALTKIGAGTFTLSGANSFTGLTSIQNGTLLLANGSALATGANVQLGGATTNGVLDVNGNNITVAGLSTTGAGNNNIIGNSSTSSPATINYAGGSSAFNGVIQNTLGVGNQTVALNVNSGTLTLSRQNTYTGNTTIGGGALIVTGSLASAGNVGVNTGGILSGTGNGTSSGSVGNVTLNGGSLRPGLTAADNNIGSITMSSLNVSSGEFRLDLTSPTNGDKVIVNGAANFTGASSITLGSIPAAGTYTFLSAQTVSGTAPTPPPGSGNSRTSFSVNFDTVGNQVQLIVNGSPLNITWTGANSGTWDLHTTANWTDSTTASDKYFDLDSVVFGDGPTNRTVQLDFTAVPGAVTFTNSVGNDYTVQGGGGIGDSGLTGGTPLTIAGGGKVTLSTANSYLGPTSVQNGTLVLNNGSALPTNAKLRLGSGSNSGGVDLNSNSITVTELSTSGTGASNVIGNSGGGQSTINYAGAASTFGGVIQDTFDGNGSSNVALNVNTGTLVLTGNSTYTGQTNINNGAALQLGNGGPTGGIVLNNVNNSGLLVFSRDGTLVVTGNISGSGATQINSGTVQVGNGSNTGSLSSGSITNNATLAFNRSDDITIPIVSGTGAIRKQGTGAATFGANTYTGNTIIEAGKAIATSATAFGAASAGTVTVMNGGAIDIAGFPTANLNPGFGAKQFFVEGTGPDGNGAVLNSGGLAQQNAFQSITLTNDALFNANSRMDIRGAQAQATLSGTLNLNGHTLTKIGGGTLTFAATDIKDGNIVVNAGTLATEGATQLVDFGTGKTLTFNATSGDVAIAFFQNTQNGGVLSRPMVFNNLGGSPDILNPANSASVTINSNVTMNGTVNFSVTQPLTWAGNLNNGTVAGSVSKSSTGVLTLSGSNGYTGGTNVGGGTLITSTNFSNGTLNFGGGMAQVSQKATSNSAAGLTVVPALQFGNTLDLTNNAMVIDYIAGSSQVNDIRNALASGYSGGAWTGSGITSSTAAAYNAVNIAGKRALGFAEASAIGVTSFAGHSVDNTSVLVGYTLAGDANLDFKVNALDFNAVATNFGVSGANLWNQGDFNYDGTVDANDFTAMGQNFGLVLPSAAPVPVLGSLVPEPGTISLLAIGSLLRVRRRRRIL